MEVLLSKRILQRTLEKLPIPKSGNRITWDSEVPGFGVRVTAAGVISFVLDYRSFGRQRRYTIGRHPELSVTAARDKAIGLRAKIREGLDPMEEREQGRTAPTLSDLATKYLEEVAEPHKRKNTLRNDRQMIDGIIRPSLGNLRLKAVGKRDIEALHTSLKGTPYRANRVLSLLSKIFNTAIAWGWRSDNPAKGIPRFHEEKRERWLSAQEISAFSAALDSYDDQNAANALRLLLLTGSRAGEVLSATWDQFDLERAAWTKPSHHTKQKRIEHVPLSPLVVELLRAMRPKHARGPLFPGRDGKRPRISIRRPWIQACRSAGLVTVIEKKGKRRKKVFEYKPTVRIHDLRHSYASHLVSSGVSLPVVGKLLGHTQPQTTARYAHLSDRALQDATDLFADLYKAQTGRVS